MITGLQMMQVTVRKFDINYISGKRPFFQLSNKADWIKKKKKNVVCAEIALHCLAPTVVQNLACLVASLMLDS